MRQHSFRSIEQADVSPAEDTFSQPVQHVFEVANGRIMHALNGVNMVRVRFCFRMMGSIVPSCDEAIRFIKPVVAVFYELSVYPYL